MDSPSRPPKTSSTLTPSSFRHTRRSHLKTLGMLPFVGSGLLAAGASTNAAAFSCSLAPSMTEGPFWVDEKLNRANLTTGTSRASVLSGIPLVLDISLYDDNGQQCSLDPAANVQVDLWHCDAAGDYSDVSGNGQANTLGQDFLRGYQVSNSTGKTTFTTIYPGWYNGRTAHIHLRARVYSAAGNTTYNFTSQLFFDDAVSDVVYAKAPYNTRGNRNTRNSNDNIYLGSAASPLVLLTPMGNGGYFGEVALGLAGVPATPQLRSFSVTTVNFGTSTTPTLVSDVVVAAADTGSTGEAYVAAEVTSTGAWYFNNGSTWIPVANPANGGFPVFARGTLGTSHKLTILSGMNTSALGKTNIYVGYGTDALNMLQNQRVQLAYTLNG